MFARGQPESCLHLNFDGFVKSPSAALRFNFVVAAPRGLSPQFLRALHCRGERALARNTGVRPDAPTIETIVPVTFYEFINFA